LEFVSMANIESVKDAPSGAHNAQTFTLAPPRFGATPTTTITITISGGRVQCTNATPAESNNRRLFVPHGGEQPNVAAPSVAEKPNVAPEVPSRASILDTLAQLKNELRALKEFNLQQIFDRDDAMQPGGYVEAIREQLIGDLGMANLNPQSGFVGQASKGVPGKGSVDHRRVLERVAANPEGDDGAASEEPAETCQAWPHRRPANPNAHRTNTLKLPAVPVATWTDAEKKQGWRWTTEADAAARAAYKEKLRAYEESNFDYDASVKAYEEHLGGVQKTRAAGSAPLVLSGDDGEPNSTENTSGGGGAAEGSANASLGSGVMLAAEAPPAFRLRVGNTAWRILDPPAATEGDGLRTHKVGSSKTGPEEDDTSNEMKILKSWIDPSASGEDNNDSGDESGSGHDSGSDESLSEGELEAYRKLEEKYGGIANCSRSNKKDYYNYKELDDVLKRKQRKANPILAAAAIAAALRDKNKAAEAAAVAAEAAAEAEVVKAKAAADKAIAAAKIKHNETLESVKKISGTARAFDILCSSTQDYNREIEPANDAVTRLEWEASAAAAAAVTARNAAAAAAAVVAAIDAYQAATKPPSPVVLSAEDLLYNELNTRYDGRSPCNCSDSEDFHKYQDLDYARDAARETQRTAAKRPDNIA
jgi:hypothetical protein